MAASVSAVPLSLSLHFSSFVSGRDNCCTTETKLGRSEELGCLRAKKIIEVFLVEEYHYTNLTVVCLSVCDVRAGGHGKRFDPS